MVDAIVILHAAHCVVVYAIYVLYVILEHYNVM